MVFDIPTLIALVALTCFCWAGALAWMARQRYRELFWWAGGVALHGLGYALYLLRDIGSDWLSVVAANLSLSFSLLLLGVATLRFRGRAVHPAWLWLPTLAMAVVVVALIDNQRWRPLWVNLVIAWQGGTMVFIVLSREGLARNRGMYVLCVSAALGALVALMRAFESGTAVFGVTELMTPTPVKTATFALVVVLFQLMTLGAVMAVLERVSASLADSEARYREVFENASEGIVVLQSQQIRMANSAALRMLGLSESEAIGRDYLSVLHE